MKKKILFIALTIISIILVGTFTILDVNAFLKLKELTEPDAYRVLVFIGWLIMVLASFIASFIFLVQVLKLSGKKEMDSNEKNS